MRLSAAGCAQAALPAEKLGAVCGQTVEALAGRGERDPLAELRVPWVARQQRLAGVIELRDHELRGASRVTPSTHSA